jgi:hypothetical protein
MDNQTETVHTIPEQPKGPAALRIPAEIISYIFHPVFMATLLAAVLYLLSPTSFAGWNEKQMIAVLLRIAYTTVFFPLLTMILMKGLGFIESIQMKNPKERIIPLMAMMVYYFWAYHVSKNIDPPILLRALLLSSFWAVIAIFMISIFFKISMHTTAAGGMVGIMIVLMLTSPVNMAPALFVTIALAGIIGTSRLVLKAHSSPEIWLGYIVGILVQLGAYWYLK